MAVSVMFFSPSKLAFYSAALIGAYKTAGTLPADLVPITMQTWLTFAQQPPTGKVLAQAAGQPVWA